MRIALFLLFVILVSQVKAQVRENVELYIYTKTTASPAAFAWATINDKKVLYFSDIKGKLNIRLDPSEDSIAFHCFECIPKKIPASELSTGDTVWIGRSEEKLFLENSQKEALELVKKMRRDYRLNSPYRQQEIRFVSYNKLSATPDSLQNLVSRIDNILSLLSLYEESLSFDRHLLLMESVSEKVIKNENYNWENILASKVSGIANPNVYTISSTLQPQNIFADNITLAGANYLSPLNRRYEKNYLFEILIEGPGSMGEVALIAFSPKRKRHEGLRGFLLLRKSDYTLKAVHFEPAYRNIKLQYNQQFKSEEEKKYFPEIARTEIFIPSARSVGSNLRILGVTRYDSIRLEDRKKISFQYKEEVLTFDESKLSQREVFLDRYRRPELSQQDSLTYSYYQDQGSIKGFDRISKLAEGILYGSIPLSMVNIDVREIQRINAWEGLRLGLGMMSNAQLSQRFSIGGHMAYGFRDQDWKYGLRAELYPTKDSDQAIAIRYMDDLKEAAEHHYLLDKAQFNSERLRQTRLGIFDRASAWEFTGRWRPLPYLRLAGAFTWQERNLLYDYSFNDVPLEQFSLREWAVGVRYGFGEQYIRTIYNKISIGSNYPLFYLTARQGQVFIPGQDQIRYRRLDMKMEGQKRLLDLGTFSYQVTAGLADAGVPYALLFNMKGSYRDPSFVIRNSFETMFYNEFLSNRYFAFFLSHAFPKIVISQRARIRPSFELMHNFGYGWLSQPDIHGDISFNTMERGFFETGVLINDLIGINLYGLKIDFGGGIFSRHGPLAIPRLWDNTVKKVVVNFNF